MSRKATKPTAKPKAKTAKKSAAKSKPTKKSPVRNKPAKKPQAKRVATAKRLGVFVVQQKTYGVYGDTRYTDPDRVFADEKTAQQYADALNRDLIALGSPFASSDAGSRITGGDKALTALVAPLKLPLPNATQWGPALDWASWWAENYFNMTAEQRNALCLALDKFDWYQVRTTTLE